MSEGAMIFVAGMVVGIVIGGMLSWHRFVRAERPTIKVVAGREFLNALTTDAMNQWADARGLVWMPKGADFKPKVKP